MPGRAQRRSRNLEMICARFRVRANARPGMTSLLHSRIHQTSHLRAEIFALAGALRHEDGKQLFLRIDPEERSTDPAPEKLADRARERRQALIGSQRKAGAKAVPRSPQHTHLELALRTEMGR